MSNSNKSTQDPSSAKLILLINRWVCIILEEVGGNYEVLCFYSVVRSAMEEQILLHHWFKFNSRTISQPGGARGRSEEDVANHISLSRSPPQIECGRCIVRMMAMAGPGRTLTIMYGSNPLSSRYVFLRVLLGFHPISTCILMFSIFQFGLLFRPIMALLLTWALSLSLSPTHWC